MNNTAYDRVDIVLPEYTLPNELSRRIAEISSNIMQMNPILVPLNRSTSHLFQEPSQYENETEPSENYENIFARSPTPITQLHHQEQDSEQYFRLPNLQSLIDNLSTGSNIQQLQLQCPICNQHIPMIQLPIHISEAHPVTYQLWLYMTMPTLYESLFADSNDGLIYEENTENANANALGILRDHDIDTMTYDQLLNLCDSIGYHKVGYTNEQKETICEDCVYDIELASQTPLCAICLNEFNETNETTENQESELEPDSHTESEPFILSRIQKCKHVFCKPCIYKWLDTNKTCPVCKQVPLE